MTNESFEMTHLVSIGPFQTLFLNNPKSLNYWTTSLDSAWKMTPKILKTKSSEVMWSFEFSIFGFQIEYFTCQNFILRFHILAFRLSSFIFHLWALSFHYSDLAFSTLKLLLADFRFRLHYSCRLHLVFRFSDFRFAISDFWFQISNFRFQLS